MSKKPAFQFYPGDWMKDPALRAVSLPARGLWIDTLCLMFESHRRGYLEHRTGSPVTPEQLARMVGCSVEEVTHLLLELENCGVLSSTEHGVIYSRRMIRDAERAVTNRDNGKKGGNPNLVAKSDNRIATDPVNRPPNRSDNRKPTPSSSSSSSDKEIQKPPLPFFESLKGQPPPGEGNGRRGGKGTWIDPGDLKSPEKILSWLTSHAKRLGFTADQADEFDTQAMVMAASVRAVSVADDPGALFHEIVSGKLWGVLSDEQLATGKRLLGEHYRSMQPVIPVIGRAVE